MNLEQLRAALKKSLDALAALKTKALGPDGTDEDLTAVETALAEVKSIERKISVAEEAEAAEARSVAKAPVAGIGHNGGPAMPAQPKSVDPADVLALTAAAILVGKGRGENPLKVLEQEGYSGLAGELRPAKGIIDVNGQKTVNTLVSGDGGILVPAAQVGGNLIPLLSRRSTFLSSDPTVVELTNGQFKQGRGATGASAAYVGQGAAKPMSTPTFDAIDMAAKKLAGIVAITDEAVRWTVGNIVNYVREMLRNAIAETMDLNAYLGTGAGSSPLGILNKSGVQTVTGTYTSATAPTLKELDTLATAMILKMTTAFIYPNGGRWRWVMSYRTAAYLSNMRVGNSDGDFAFPTMQGFGVNANISWKGFPVTVTAVLPTNGGGTTDESTLALVDFSHVLYGEDMGLIMKMSDQATISPDGGTTMINLWQDNLIALLAETSHDFGLRYAKAVVKTTVRY